MFYIIDKSTRAVVRQSATPFNVDETVKPSGNVVQLKSVDDNTVPAYDPTTQKLNRNFRDDDAAGTRTNYYEVIALSTAELAAVAKTAQDEANRQQVKAVYAALMAGTGTAAERLVRLEKCVAYLLKDSLQ